MGIRGLTSLIKIYAPEALQTHSLQYFNGSRIAIDTSILLYKFRYSNQHQNSHISGFMNRCMNYIRHGIIPIFIIDGKPPPEKSETILRRQRHRQKLEARINDLKQKLGTTNESKKEILSKISKLDKQIITVTKEHHEDTQELLKILGFQVIKSPGEAEETCAYLQRESLVNFTYSDDTDVLPLGCEKVLRSNGKSNSFTEIDLKKVLIGLNLTFEEFIDLCILCGCDYCSNIPRLNYQKAYELIKKYNSIENIIEYHFEQTPLDFNYKNARNIFKKNIDIKNIKTIVGINEPPQLDELRLYRFLSRKRFNKRYIDNYIRKFRDIIKTKFPSNDNPDESFTKYFKVQRK